MRGSETWTDKSLFRFDSAATYEQVSDFLDARPGNPLARFETDFGARTLCLVLPPGASQDDAIVWTARILDTGLFLPLPSK